jgi:hypothetical protein
LLTVEFVEARLEANEPGFAALACERALLEGFVVALQRLLGAGDLGADRGEPLLELGPVPLGLLAGPRARMKALLELTARASTD